MNYADSSVEETIIKRLRELIGEREQSAKAVSELNRAIFSKPRARDESLPDSSMASPPYVAPVQVTEVSPDGKSFKARRVVQTGSGALSYDSRLYDKPLEVSVPEGQSAPVFGDQVTVFGTNRINGGNSFGYAMVAPSATCYPGVILTAIAAGLTTASDAGGSPSISPLPLTEISTAVLYDHYYVKIYPSGVPPRQVVGDESQVVDNPSQYRTLIASVRQLDIAVGMVIPPETWVQVFRSGKDFYMQVPIWL